jgi:hypothetical protein
MGATKCITLTFKEECDDLIGVTSGGWIFEHDGGLIILAS